MRLIFSKFFKQLLLPGRPVAMHTRTRHTTAFAGHHFDELPRSLARFGICTQQSDVLLCKVSDLNRVEVSDLVFFQIHLHSIDHASGLGKSMRLTYSIEQVIDSYASDNEGFYGS